MPQDFSGQNLRGRNFKDRNLTGANFSHADIRGANFSHAILIGANFSHAKGGLPDWATALLVLSSFFLPISTALGLVRVAKAVAKALTNLFVLPLDKIIVEAWTTLSNTAFDIWDIQAIVIGSLYWAWFWIKNPNEAWGWAWINPWGENLAKAGTNFQHADLTNANFTQAFLEASDFTSANLTHTCFFGSKIIARFRADKTILSNTSVQNLLFTHNGRNKSYAGVELRGANLIGANLSYANFKKADLTDAIFCGANLESANLTLTQAIGTDFTSARMTGACVEGWNIESNTKLDNVDCRFIYLLENPKPKTDDRERRPSSGEFKPGEFTKLFEEVLTTVDLIFDKGIDWKAFIAAFKKVQVENEDTELTIQSIENKGDGVIVVRVSVPPDANKEKIHSDFTQNYALALKAVEEKYKAELQAKDREIQIYREKSVDMKEIIGLLATRPININNEAIATSESKSMSEASKYDQRGAQFAGGFAETVQGDQIGGNIHNYAAQQNLAEAAKDIQQLLQQLSESNPTNTPSEKMVVVEKAIKQIEADPTLRERVIGAMKSGGIEAFKELIDHPLVNILVAALEGWQVGD